MPKIMFTKEEINTIIKMYQEGKTQEEIGNFFNCTKKPIKRILKENNIPTNIRRTNRVLNHNYFSVINSHSKGYLLGLLFSDGNISYTPNRDPLIRLQLLKEDINLLEFFKSEINSNSKIYDNKDGTFTFSVRSKQIAKDLEYYNIIPNKTFLIKQLPKNIPQEYYIDFLRGLIDGDGSLYFNSNDGSFHLSFTSHYIELVQDYINIIANILNLDLSNRKPTYYNKVAKFTLNGKDAYLFADLLYQSANIYCNRKYKKYSLAKEKYFNK